MSLRTAAVSKYRTLLRTCRSVFDGDVEAFRMAHAAVRLEFDRYASLEDPSQIQERLREADEANEFIRANIVQAHLNDAGNYAIRIEPQHAGASSQVRGSIHIESAGDRAAGDPTASTQKEAGCCSDDNHHDHHHHDDHTASQRRA